MPAVPIHVFARSADSSAMSTSSSLGPVYVAGFIVVGLAIIGLAIWYGIRIYKKRSRARRDDARGAAFLSVRGLVKESDETEKEPLPENLQAIQGKTFSRSQITRSIVLPEKVLTRSQSTIRKEVLDFHRQSGNFPRPFAPGPFSFALGAGSSSTRSSMLRPDSSNRLSLSPFFRNSVATSLSSRNRFSVLSTTSSASFNSTAGTPRKVRQLFNPILPDELLVTVGERLTVVQSFDDGWCVVGRENSVFASTAKSLFKPASPAVKENNVELGVIPAWCFLKAVKGLRAERPVRSSSLGITVQMEGPGFSSRDEVLSWSNF